MAALCEWHWPTGRTELYCGIVSVSLVLAAVAKVVAPKLDAAPAAPSAATPLVSSRENWVDAARFALICLILIGHFAATPVLWISERQYWLGPLLVWINLFVMPGFAALSGYLSKAPLTSARASRVLIFIGLPYLLNKVSVWLFSSYWMSSIQFINPLDTFSNGAVTWYLIVLVQWRLAISVLRPLSNNTLIFVSIFAGLTSGYWIPSSTLAGMHRAFSFFPFFVLGYVLDLDRIRTKLLSSTIITSVLRLSFFGFLAALWCFQPMADAFMSHTLGELDHDYTSAVVPAAVQHTYGATNPGFMTDSLENRTICGSEWVLSAVHRLVRYEIGLMLLCGLLVVVPASNSFARPGRYCMYPYCLHPWITLLVIEPYLLSHPTVLWKSIQPFATGGFVWAYCLIISPVIAYLFTTAPVRALTWPLIEPTWAAPYLLSPENAALFVEVKPTKAIGSIV